MSHALLEKTAELPAVELSPKTIRKSTHPFAVTFSVVVNPAYEHHPETLDVFMQSEHETLQVDTLPSSIIAGQTTRMKADFVKASFAEACSSLSVTFQKASERATGTACWPHQKLTRPVLMAGWTVDGGDRRFILEHRGEKEVLRNMAYVTGSDAHALLGLQPHHAGDVRRAQMIFKYDI